MGNLGEHPRDAVRYIDELGLYHTVFTDPSKPDMPKPDLTGWSTAYEFLYNLSSHPFYKTLVTSNEDRFLAWVLVCVVPFSRVPNQGNHANPRKNPPAATLAAREGTRTPNRVCDTITAAVSHRAEIVTLKELVSSGGEGANARDHFGMAIRRWEAYGKNWRLQVFFAMLDEVMMQAQTTLKAGSTSAGGDETPASAASPISDEIDRIQRSWEAFFEHLRSMSLMDAPAIKPLMDGRTLSTSLGIKPGKWMTAAMDVCIAWQLRNPEETDPAGAVEEVRRRKDELGLADLLKE